MAVDITTIGIEVDTREVKSASRDLDNLEKSAKRAAGGADETNSSFAALSRTAVGLLGVLGTAGIGRVLLNQVDEYTKYSAQIRNATRSQDEFNSVLEKSRLIAKESQSTISSISTLYARLLNNTRDLGVTQNQVASVVETLSLALKSQGATAQEAESSMLQLSQSFGKGRLDGDELRTALEAMPNVMRQLANSMGVPFGALKDLGEQGKLTSDVLIKAFTDPQYIQALRNQVEQTKTISGAWQVLKNEVNLTIGRLNEATGASNAFAKALDDFAASSAIRVPFETIAVLGANIAYVFKQVGNEIGGIAAQITRFMSGDFKGAMAIREQMLADAKSARAEIDRVTAAILNPSVSDGPMEKATANIANNSKAAAVDTTKALNNVQKLNEDQRQMLRELQNQIDLEAEIAVDKYNAEKKALDDIAKEQQKAAEEYRRQQFKLAQEISDNRVKEYKDAQKAIEKENERMAESLSRAITDGIFRGFENGKSFFRNFLDALVNGLKTALVQPLISGIIKSTGIASIFSSVTSFAGDGLVSSGGGIGGIFNTIKDGLSSLNTDVVGSIEKLGVFLSSGNGGLADNLGGIIGQYSNQIATGLSFAPAVFSLLKGDVKGAAFQAGGAAIGTAIAGPVGGAIGSFLGGALGSVFGGKKKNPRVGAGVSSTYLDGQFSSYATKGGAKKYNAELVSPLTNLNRAFSQTLGGYLSELGIDQRVNVNSLFATKSKKTTIAGISGTVGGKGFGSIAKGYTKDASESWQQFANEVFGPVLVQAIKASSLSSGLKALFNGMTNKTQIVAMMNATVALNKEQTNLADKYSITVDQAAKVAKATGATGNALVDMVNKLAGAVRTTGSVLVQARESLMSNMGGRELPTTLKAFDDILQGIDKSTQAGIQAFADLFSIRDQFAAFTQSIDQLKGGVNSTLMPFLSAQEQQSIKQAELAKVFDSLNMTVPGSLEELISLGKAIDYTTKEGLDLAAVFPQLVQAFQATTDQTNALINSLGQLDINKFRTLFDYTRAGAYLQNGISLDRLPSYDVGTSYVPQTGPAMIHQGERIMTASENRDYSASIGAMVSEIRSLRQDNSNMSAELKSIALSAYKSAASLDRLERDGFIVRDVDQNGDPQILQVEVVTP